MYIGKLSDKYESNGDPGAIGFDPGGGWSYGTNQIATKTGTFGYFMEYLKGPYPDFFKALTDAGGFAAATAGSEDFKVAWKKCATDSPDNFKACQHNFIVASFYGTTISRLKTIKVNLSSPPHSNTLADVIYSMSVMAGCGAARANGSGSCGLIYDTLASMNAIDSLGMVEDSVLIDAIYDHKLKRIDSGREYGTQPPNIRASVRNRVVNEHRDAVSALVAERTQLSNPTVS